MAKQDLYALLGVAPDASSAAIDSAYQQACNAIQTGPDPHGGDAHNRLKFLRFAHETLLHAGRRKAYDASLLKTVAPSRAPVKTKAKVAPMPLVLGAAGVAAVALALFLVTRPAPVRPALLPAAVAAVPASLSDLTPSLRLTTEELFERNSQSVVVIVGLNADSKPILQGSGVVVADQRVITNCHVAKSAAGTQIKLGDKVYAASLLRVDSDPLHDLCLLAVDGLHAPAIALATISSVKVGKKVFALGAPKGLDLTLSEGIVSSLREYNDSHFIQTTASISPGSSGGGLFDDTGELVGITTFQRADGQNLNFAVPVDWVKKLMESKESLAVLGPTSMSDLMGTWQCDSNKEKEPIQYRFKHDGMFAMSRPEWKGRDLVGSYAIMSNHTLVLKSPAADPPEMYLQIMALNSHDLRISSPFYEDAQTYQCKKIET
jgi:serine protease Do